ncbi:MAG TPA: hypothetical protein P5204_11440, partial [Kiritimatiellia bacterium]|nr:hypothetical protein [Kiritimatiellia bacterium]
SFAATRPLQSGNSRAVASLAVQRLLGQELTTEKAARAAYLHQAEDATPEQLIAEANRLADSKVGEAMKQALASPDPTTAYRIGAANAELDAISAARAGVQTGLKMGISATKAEQTATKRLIRDAEAAQAQDFVVATGIDPVKVMLAVQPDVFAAREKEEEGPQPPEGPQQESGQKAEPPKATPEQMAERDRRKRNIVEQVRAWADQERARREKEAEEAAKKKAEGAEGAGEGAEAPQEEAPDEPGIPPELLTGEGADLRDANEMARALRLWIADWIVERSKGRLTHQTLWADAEAISQYKKTAVAILTDAAYKMVAPGDYALSTIQGMIDDLPSVAMPDTVERRSASVIAVIQANAIRQSRNELIAQIRKDIDAMALQGGPVDPMQEDLKRKITGEQQKTAAFVKRILSWSPKKIEAEREKIKVELEGRENLYRDSANGEEPLKVAIDAQYHHNLMKLQMLDRWGGIKGMLPAEIVEAGIEIRGWMKSAQERLYARWQDMAAQTGKLTADIARAVVPEDQNAPRPKDGWFDAFLGSHLATVRQRLEGLVRNAKDEPTRQAALAAIEELMFHLSRGSEIYATTINDYRKAWTDAVAEITGSRKAASQYLRHLDEPIPADVSAKVSRQGFAGTMTYGQAIQLYASLKQVGSYAENARRHKRLDHADLIESILTPEDVKLVGRLRRIYEQRRAALSDVVRSVTGIPVWRPDPLYMPVQMLTGRPGGLGIVGTVRAWNPLADSLTPRRRNGLDFDESVSVQDMFMQRSEDAARAIAFGARGILIRGVLGDADFQNAVDRYVGKAKLTELLKQTTQAMAGIGRENADKASRVAAWLRRVNTYTALSGNMLSAAKQTVSFPVFAMTLDGGFREVVESVKAFDRQALAELMDSDGYRARYGGGISPEIAEAMRNPDANLVKRLYAAGMTVIQIGDMVASLSVATGIYKAKKAAYVDQGMDEETATERAKTMTWAMVEETQQSSRPENMPAFYRNQNEFLKLFLQFASAPALQLSHEFHAAADVKAGVPGAKGRLARAILINHFIVPALLDLMSAGFYWLLGRPPEDEDKELWRRIRDRVAWNFLIGPFSRMLIVGAVVDSGYKAMFEGKLFFGSNMIPAESTVRTISYLLRAGTYDVATQDTEQLRDDLLKAIEGASAPARHAIMLIENRIAGD